MHRDATPYLQASAADQARHLRDGDISAEALVEAALARMAATQDAVNAVVQPRVEGALQEARAADRRRRDGGPCGPLHGVPITVKDSFDTHDLVSTAGTLGRMHHRPAADATVVARLRAAGAILLGKTNTPELTLAYNTDNLVYGATRNPYDLTRSTGGSSGGSAASVALGIAALDVGSDTAGSIRYPAHCCGVAGLKPTAGRVPRTGHIIGFAGLQQSLTCVGPLARRVGDLDLALRVVAGPDGIDPYVVDMPLRHPGDVSLSGLRVGLFTGTSLAQTDPEVIAAVRAAADAVASHGARVDEVALPDLAQAFDFFPRFFGADGAAGLEAYLAALGTTELSPQVRGAVMLMRPYGISSAALGDLVVTIDLWRSQLLQAMAPYDLWLGPAATRVAQPPEVHWDDPGCSWAPSIFACLVPFNFTGAPVVVVPAGHSADTGLPIGVQCVARHWREDVALCAATAIEAAQGGWQPPPR